MKKRIVRWYYLQGYRVSDFYDEKRHCGVKLLRAQIDAGLESYYNRVVKDKEIEPKRIQIGWGVINEARRVRYGDYLKDNEILEEWKPIIVGLREQLGWVKWSRFRWRLGFLVLFGVAYYLFFRFVEYSGGIAI